MGKIGVDDAAGELRTISRDAVKVLVEAGANLTVTDRAYHGTPLGWAKYMRTETTDNNEKKKYAAIEAYLLAKENS